MSRDSIGTDYSQPVDSRGLEEILSQVPAWGHVVDFQPNEHIRRLDARVDVDQLRQEVEHCLGPEHDQGDGFHTVNVTCRPGTTSFDATSFNATSFNAASFDSRDLSGRYWIKPTADSPEEARDEIVDESAYTETVPQFVGTYIEEVTMLLRSIAAIGRVRILGKDRFNCNSWHRDPEPRLHIPIVANPGSLFVVNNHATHLPADGSIYFTDTRAYHTALNGGEASRVSMVAALVL